MSETAITKNITNLLTQRQAWWIKNHAAGAGRRGIPDLTIIYRGHPIVLEIKTPTGRLTRLQTHELQHAAHAGAIVAVVTHHNQVASILDKIDQAAPE